MNRIIKLLSLTLIVALAVGLSLCLVGCTETEYQPGGGALPATEDLEILSHSMSTTGFGNLMVKGIAKNVSSSNLSYAEVKVKFYDAQGNLISTWLDNINDLGAGETWSFEVMYLGMDTENVKSYQIGVGSVW